MTIAPTEIYAPAIPASALQRLLSAILRAIAPTLLTRRAPRSIAQLADWDIHRLRDVGMEGDNIVVEAKADFDRDPWSMLQRWP